MLQKIGGESVHFEFKGFGSGPFAVRSSHCESHYHSLSLALMLFGTGFSEHWNRFRFSL